MEEFIGTIKMFAGNFAPQNWAFCDGRLIDIRENTAMYSILGNQFGGDGVSNFALPNLAATPSGAEGAIQHIICMNGLYPPRG